MQINSVDSNTQFGAKFISPAKVRYKAGKVWKDLDVSLIKFDTNKMEDRSKLDAVSRLWGGKNMSAAIAEEANILGGGSHVYGITLQKGNIEENVLPDHILGLMSTGAAQKYRKNIEMFKIGTNPKFAYEQNRRTRDIKHIARGMIEAFKSYIGGTPKLTVSYAEPSEVKFLNKVGIEPQSSEIVQVING